MLLAELRDPVDRAYSAWNMYHFTSQRPGSTLLHDPRRFDQAVEAELAGVDRPMQHRYLHLSDYATKLEPYLKLFPRENLLLFGYPRSKRDLAAVVNEILERWKLPAMDPRATIFGKRSNTKPYLEPLDPKLRLRLHAYFAPRIQALYELVGKNLDVFETHGGK